MLSPEQLKKLSQPFSVDQIQWKPGAVNRDKTRCLALAYVDSRHYMARLDQVDPGWSDSYEVLPGDNTVVCRLTVGGVTRTDLGRKDEAEQNSLTSAAAQAFKRACTKFGLGRHLYFTDSPWVPYDAQRRCISDEAVAGLRRSMNGSTGEAQESSGDSRCAPGKRNGTNGTQTTRAGNDARRAAPGGSGSPSGTGDKSNGQAEARTNGATATTFWIKANKHVEVIDRAAASQLAKAVQGGTMTWLEAECRLDDLVDQVSLPVAESLPEAETEADPLDELFS